jgi:L,D-transpeptidase ErfK/SrfK
MTPLLTALLLVTQIFGADFTYKIQPGDSLTSIGARYGIDPRVIAEANTIKLNERLQPGQELKLDNRHIAPAGEGVEIIVNVPQRMLFRFENGAATCGYPIAAGRTTWRTPLGGFEVVTMEENPTWDVPPSIQEEMRQAGKPVLTHVPPGPDNPLGKYWIGLSLSGIGIHGTNAPSSVYKLTTHGCIRLHPDDVESLFSRIDVGTKGRFVYEPVLLERIENAVFLEVHPDAYGKAPDPLAKALRIAAEKGLTDMLDLRLVSEVIRKRDGIARDVTRR